MAKAVQEKKLGGEIPAAVLDVDFDKVVDNLCRAAWKLQGVAGLFFIEETGGSKGLEQDQANGLSFLLEQIAGDILANTERIYDVR